MQHSFPLWTLPLSCQSSGVEASDWPEYWPLIGQDEMDHVTPYNTLLESVTLQNHGFCSYTREMEDIKEWHFLCPDGHQLLDSQSHRPSGWFRTQTGRFRIELPRLVMQKDKLDRLPLCNGLLYLQELGFLVRWVELSFFPSNQFLAGEKM